MVALAILRGALLDLLATDDVERITAAIHVAGGVSCGGHPGAR